MPCERHARLPAYTTAMCASCSSWCLTLNYVCCRIRTAFSMVSPSINPSHLSASLPPSAPRVESSHARSALPYDTLRCLPLWFPVCPLPPFPFARSSARRLLIPPQLKTGKNDGSAATRAHCFAFCFALCTVVARRCGGAGCGLGGGTEEATAEAQLGSGIARAECGAARRLPGSGWRVRVVGWWLFPAAQQSRAAPRSYVHVGL
ncbi:uncharacterized protein J3D65DRAFT_355922 [Phyllosticta citribraziliensis]|uniref:Uncharacterized protein n=1 Tax=Phyllosticta citribraziliensis TaxID=989973 RepID=A0ABR1LQ39_9PEZI